MSFSASTFRKDTARSTNDFRQLNGAELPCGSVLTVEPSTSSYGSKVLEYYCPSTGALQEGPPEVDNGGAKVEGRSALEADDLDDFFNAL